MSSKYVMLIAGVLVGVLLTAGLILLAPAVLADSPFDGYGPGFGGMMNGAGAWLNQDNQTGPMAGGFMQGRGRMGMRGQGQGAFGPMRGQAGFGRMNGAAGPMMGRGGRMGWGGPENSLIAVVAEELGMERTELINQLQDGDKTLRDVITANGGDAEAIIETFIAARQERLDQLVEDGQLTEAQRDSMLAMMKARVTEHLDSNWSEHQRGPGFVDEDGDGVCDHAGSGAGRGMGRGSGFVDEDGDGVCDYAGQGAGRGQGPGRGAGRGQLQIN